MARYITVLPAYGRDYKTAKATKADWLAGKDFLLSNVFDPDDGHLINLEDARRAGYTNVVLRFARLAKLCSLPIAKEVAREEA